MADEISGRDLNVMEHEIRETGLYVDLDAWGFHVLKF